MIRTGAFAIMLALGGCAADGTSPVLGDVLGAIGAATGPSTGSSTGGPLTAFEVDQGLRQALVIGTDRVVSRLGVANGYFGDPRVRIPLPGRLGELQSTLQRVGLSAPLDDLQLRLNRAAESAVPAGRDLIVDAVSSITLDDAMGILRGGETAATDFLRRKTEASLTAAFRPWLESELAEVGAFSALDGVSAQYGLTGLGTSLRASLVEHGVTYGLDGMFGYLAEEERAIRQDPVRRTTELLRRVFGSVG